MRAVLLDPVLEIADRVAADAELEQVKSHAAFQPWPVGVGTAGVAPQLFVGLEDNEPRALRRPAAPGSAATSATSPSAGATSACSIFIASTIARRWPFSTSSPGSHEDGESLPCIGALTAPPRRCARDRPSKRIVQARRASGGRCAARSVRRRCRPRIERVVVAGARRPIDASRRCRRPRRQRPPVTRMSARSPSTRIGEADAARAARQLKAVGAQPTATSSPSACATARPARLRRSARDDQRQRAEPRPRPRRAAAATAPSASRLRSMKPVSKRPARNSGASHERLQEADIGLRAGDDASSPSAAASRSSASSRVAPWAITLAIIGS